MPCGQMPCWAIGVSHDRPRSWNMWKHFVNNVCVDGKIEHWSEMLSGKVPSMCRLTVPGIAGAILAVGVQGKKQAAQYQKTVQETAKTLNEA